MGTAAVVAVASGPVLPVGAHAAGAAATDVADLQKMAHLVTGKQVDQALAERAGSAITENHPGFPAALAKLQDFAASNNITDVEMLKDAPGFEGDLKDTAKLLIGALYLGYSGTPKALSSVDDVKFVTYTQALTFQLTHPYTPIPSYSRWGTGYWAERPGRI